MYLCGQEIGDGIVIARDDLPAYPNSIDTIAHINRSHLIVLCIHKHFTFSIGSEKKAFILVRRKHRCFVFVVDTDFVIFAYESNYTTLKITNRHLTDT